MRKIMFLFVPVFFMLFLTSCGGVPIMTSAPQNNESYRVDYLFEHEGTKVYRFYDDGRYVYFTNTRSDVTAFKSDSTKSVVVTRSQVDK